MTMHSTTITADAGRPYGHVPGRSFLDVEIAARRCGARWIATLTITAGNAQGGNGSHDQIHREDEYTRTGSDAGAAIERVRDEALSALDEDESEAARYIETAASRALRDACDDCDAAAE